MEGGREERVVRCCVGFGEGRGRGRRRAEEEEEVREERGTGEEGGTVF